jgi:sucrose-6-phosphate hydrolase SacC (GH32 family)
MSLPSRLPAILQAVMQGQPRALADSHYPRWHHAPVTGLMNDPNGFVEFAGRYHLFYQWNPLACDHKFKCWAHWSSDDLLRWRHEPIALMPDEEYDRNGCYSGSAVDNNGTLTLCYTGNVKFDDGGRTAWQCLATENADGTFTSSARSCRCRRAIPATCATRKSGGIKTAGTWCWGRRIGKSAVRCCCSAPRTFISGAARAKSPVTALTA